MRPEVHFTPLRNWMNDPVGLIYYQGNYHLFYQYFPYEKHWGTMHWGHAVSKDLVNWQHLPIALYPSKLEDCNGCFSGSAAEDGGKMYLFYTGVHYDGVNKENIHESENGLFTSCQIGMISSDGFSFDNHEKKLLIPAFTDPKLGSRVHTRDPKVWKDADGWHMVLGSQCEQQKKLAGQILFYRSMDGTAWSFQNRFCMPEVEMIECPDLFEADGNWVLMASLMGRGTGEEPEHISCGGVVDFDPESGKLRTDITRLFSLDAGMDLYAAQSMKDEQGRNVMMAWMRMPQPIDGEQWIGMYTLPRIVSVRDGQLWYTVHPYVKEQFLISCRPEFFIQGAVRMEAELEEDGKIEIGGYEIKRRGTLLHTDRTKVFPKDAGRWLRRTRTQLSNGRCDLEIYADHGIIEIFVNGGETVITQVVYGMQGTFCCENVKRLCCWKRRESE